ncbi:unnamed protein product [Ostreobium quekettii]|uniref:SET domain-containing protein n=1 Tax=Ostreobium quekettii TaxID=121088 RepID=A0A8S1IYS4_9CHLO|nr:unnamed protein product [Ostreobium quekettii]
MTADSKHGSLPPSTSAPAGIDPDRTALRQFEAHAEATNDIFLVAARVIANVVEEASRILEAGDAHGPRCDPAACWDALWLAWRPYACNWKGIWWESVAVPDDVSDEEAFRAELKELATDSLALLKSAIDDGRFPALFTAEVYGSLIGMFEMNNLAIEVPSPLESYLEALDESPSTAGSLGSLRDRIEEAAQHPGEGTAYYRLACCANHSCVPNAKATRRTGLDVGGNLALIAEGPITAGEEITISYVDESEPLEQRQRALMDYGFVCSCTRCLQEEQGP